MEEKKFVQFKKDEFKVKEFIKSTMRKGQMSSVKVEYTPVGERIIISTHKPGLIIGSRGEKVSELTAEFKKRFKLENPHIDIQEIRKPDLDSQLVADNIANSLEALGPLKFKVIAYKALQKIIDSGALGAEIKLGGKLPSDRAKSWRFSSGYLKKTGDSAGIVNKAHTTAETKTGTIGVKVSILPPDAVINDRIEVNEELRTKIRENSINILEEKENKKKSKKGKSK